MASSGTESFGDKLKRMATNCGHATGLCCFKAKEHTQISVLEAKITARQRKFGIDYMTMVEEKASQAALKKCLQDALNDLDALQGQINDHYDNIENKEADVNEKIVPSAAGQTPSNSSGSNNNGNKKKKNSNRPVASTIQDAHDDDDDDDDGPYGGKATKPNKPVGGGGGGGGKGPSDRKPAGKTGNGGAKPGGKTPGGVGGKKKKPAASGGGAGAAMAKDEVPEAYRNVDPSKWRLRDLKFQGSTMFDKKGKEEVISGQTIQSGIDRFKANPAKYTAMMYQTNMLTESWPASNCKFTYIHREGTENYRPQGVTPSGWMTILLQEYERLPRFKDDVLPKANRDKYTDAMTFQGRKLHSGKNKPIMPGRGMGVGDTPFLKVIGDVDPSDIAQGMVGDCWLLSGISSLAEFDGGIKKLFRKTKNLDQMPMDSPNMYTISLWDLKSWKEVDIEIDERLACAPNGTGLLASKLSEDGEMWVPLLEKALSIHCGGWDKIVGGQCTHAWALLTGCKEQYTIRINPDTGKYGCYAKYNPYENKWLEHANSPHDGDQSMFRVAWPKVGGGGGVEKELTENELFLKMVAWDKQNYIVGAGTKGTSDKNSTGGLVDNHAYSVIESHSNVAGTGIDLLKVRNPWGSGEIEDGEFDDDGPGWDKYPQIKKLLKPVVADDGIFWVTKQEFFQFYQTIFLSCSDMTAFLED